MEDRMNKWMVGIILFAFPDWEVTQNRLRALTSRPSTRTVEIPEKKKRDFSVSFQYWIKKYTMQPQEPPNVSSEFVRAIQTREFERQSELRLLIIRYSIPSREWIEFITTHDMSLHGDADLTRRDKNWSFLDLSSHKGRTRQKRLQLLKAVEHCTSFVKNEVDSVHSLEQKYPKMEFLQFLKKTLFNIIRSLSQFDSLLKDSPQFNLQVRDKLCESWSEVSDCFDRLPDVGELKNYLKSAGSEQLSIEHEYATSAFTVHPC